MNAKPDERVADQGEPPQPAYAWIGAEFGWPAPPVQHGLLTEPPIWHQRQEGLAEAHARGLDPRELEVEQVEALGLVRMRRADHERARAAWRAASLRLRRLERYLRPRTPARVARPRASRIARAATPPRLARVARVTSSSASSSSAVGPPEPPDPEPRGADRERSAAAPRGRA